jgi:hypothetical protein
MVAYKKAEAAIAKLSEEYRVSPKSCQSAIYGKPSPSPRTISNVYRREIPVIFRLRTGCYRTEPASPPSNPTARGATPCAD